MKIKVLKNAEKNFLKEYPGGFEHPEMLKIGKKHKMDKLHDMARASFAKKQFEDADFVVSEMVKLISRSSMISMFEKPKFKNLMSSLNKSDKEIFSKALFDILHGKEKVGFELFVLEFSKRRMAKWSIATAIQSYYRPQKEVFVKPTTTKLIINCLDLGLNYQPTPTWDFYSKYRKNIKEIKSKVNKNLSPNNPAFCGFLMMSLREDFDCGKT